MLKLFDSVAEIQWLIRLETLTAERGRPGVHFRLAMIDSLRGEATILRDAVGEKMPKSAIDDEFTPHFA